MENPNDEMAATVQGHIKIVSYDDIQTRTGEKIELDKRNSAHKENCSIALIRSWAGLTSGHAYSLHFGSGGATVDALQNVVYSVPNTTGAADLNVPIYYEVIDSKRGAPTDNSITVRHVSGTNFTDMEIRCVLDKNEPAGQAAFDNVSTTLSGNFVFDELGIKTDDNLLLTHATFSPIEKTANRAFEVVYTIRLTIV
jgi:hypothetical protein